jgi:hypothetical protein
MRVAFVLTKPSHNSVMPHWMSTEFVDEEGEFRLIDAQSCVRRSSSTQTDVSHSPRRCPTMFDPVVRGRVGVVVT